MDKRILIIITLVGLVILNGCSVLDDKYNEGYTEGNKTGYGIAKKEYTSILQEYIIKIEQLNTQQDNCIRNCRVDGWTKTYYGYGCVNECIRYY